MILKLTVYVLDNFITYEEQLKEKDTFYTFLENNVFLIHPEIRDNLLNYMLQICIPTSGNIKSLLELLKDNKERGENLLLRSQSSGIIGDITKELDGIKFNVMGVHKVIRISIKLRILFLS